MTEATTHPRASEEPPVVTTGRPPGVKRRHGVRPALLAQLLAVVPVLVIFDLVQDSSQLQWLDYWSGLARFMEPGGSIRPLDVVYFTEGHVPAIPSLVAWVNVLLTGGLAHPLGWFDIAVVLAQLLLLRWLLPGPERLGAWTFSLLVIAFAVLLFAPQGAWNFSRAASGAGWLTANLFTLIAIALAVRGRLLWAIPVAGLASLTYGTGLMAWPVLVLIGVLRESWGWRGWAVAGAGALTLALYALERPGSPGSDSGFAPNDWARRTFQVVGSVLSPNPDVALLAGAVGLGLAGFLAVACWQRMDLRRDALPWIALGAYAALAALLIGLARGGLHEDNLGVASRYASLGILLWIAVLALCVLRFRADLRVWPFAFGLVALAFAAGQPTMAGMRSAALPQDELAIALRMDVSAGYPYAPKPTDVPLFESVDHYPFSSNFEADCGLLGKRIDPRSVRPTDAATRGNLDRFDSAYNPASVRLVGWFGSAKGDTRCVVFTDESLRVIGAGAMGFVRPDVAAQGSPTGSFEVGFTGPARAGADEYRAFAAVEGQEGLYALPGALEPAGEQTVSDDEVGTTEPDRAGEP